MRARSRCQITKQRRSFSAEFKREAADLVLKQNYSYVEARRSLGIGELALRRWVAVVLGLCMRRVVGWALSEDGRGYGYQGLDRVYE
jgi:hypothetical protein